MNKLTNSVIHEKSVSVEPSDDIEDLIYDMMVVLQGKGIGLAAVQIGILKRVIIVKINGDFVVMINPVINRKGNDKRIKKEGCLSFPNLFTEKTRCYRVEVDFENKQREKVHLKLSGLAAACVQHEIDHLDGVTIK